MSIVIESNIIGLIKKLLLQRKDNTKKKNVSKNFNVKQKR